MTFLEINKPRCGPFKFDDKKKVLLISATNLNHDTSNLIFFQILLFQSCRNCSADLKALCFFLSVSIRSVVQLLVGWGQAAGQQEVEQGWKCQVRLCLR